MPVEPQIRILVVEPQRLVREGLRRLLEAQPDLEVVGEAANAEEALAQIRDAGAEVVVTELELAGMTGFDLTRLAAAEPGPPRVLALCSRPDRLLEALDAGVYGYLPKSAGHLELVQAIRAIALGAVVIDAGLADTLRPGRGGRIPAPGFLSQREQEVLERVVMGMTNRAIARELGIAPRTADQHLHSVFVKLGATSRAQVVRLAIEGRLVGRKAF